eukprot:6188313-Pleurochrysis_carterae.AAC.1
MRTSTPSLVPRVRHRQPSRRTAARHSQLAPGCLNRKMAPTWCCYHEDCFITEQCIFEIRPLPWYKYRAIHLRVASLTYGFLAFVPYLHLGHPEYSVFSTDPRLGRSKCTPLKMQKPLSASIFKQISACPNPGAAPSA